MGVVDIWLDFMVLVVVFENVLYVLCYGMVLVVGMIGLSDE